MNVRAQTKLNLGGTVAKEEKRKKRGGKELTGNQVKKEEKKS